MLVTRAEREREKQMSKLSDVRNKSYANRQPSTSISDRVVTTSYSNGHSSNANEYGDADLRARDTYNPALENSSNDYAHQDLTPAQLQLFEQENESMTLTLQNDRLAQVNKVEASLVEISQLQETLAGNIAVQHEQISGLVMDAEDTGENLTKGNRELKRASERGSTARGVFWVSVGLCSFLVVWDLIF
jgi:syntaxin 18